MRATDDMRNRFRTLERRVDQLGRAIGMESALLVRAIGWNVAASALGLVASSYLKNGARDKGSLEASFEGVARAVLDGKQVRGCARCAGPMVQQDATLVCLECSHQEEV